MNAVLRSIPSLPSCGEKMGKRSRRPRSIRTHLLCEQIAGRTAIASRKTETNKHHTYERAGAFIELEGSPNKYGRYITKTGVTKGRSRSGVARRGGAAVGGPACMAGMYDAGWFFPLNQSIFLASPTAAAGRITHIQSPEALKLHQAIWEHGMCLTKLRGGRSIFAKNKTKKHLQN